MDLGVGHRVLDDDDNSDETFSLPPPKKKIVASTPAPPPTVEKEKKEIKPPPLSLANIVAKKKADDAAAAEASRTSRPRYSGDEQEKEAGSIMERASIAPSVASTATDYWKSDSDHKECENCLAKFSIYKRRHHWPRRIAVPEAPLQPPWH